MRIGADPDGNPGIPIVAAMTMNPSFGAPNEGFVATYGLRPVFTLKDEVKVTGGSGTEDDPYTLGV